MALLSLYNLFALTVFSISVGIIAFRLLSRVLLFRYFKIKVPLLLKRDFWLFWSIVLYVGTGLIALLYGIQGLGQEPLWVIPRSVPLLASFVYWAWIEYHIEDATDTEGK